MWSKGWITQNENINTLYKRTSSNNLVLRSTVEPFNKFRIELTVIEITQLINKSTIDGLPMIICSALL